MHSENTGEFSRLAHIDKIPPSGQEMEIAASPEECAALCHRLDLVGMEALTARLTLKPAVGSGMIFVTGRYAARYTQTCVVTLEDLPIASEGDVRGVFAPPDMIPEQSGEILYEDLDDEEIEPISHGVIDVGELVVQYVALHLDPYPRKPGAAFALGEGESEEGGKTPFSVLTRLKKEKE